MSYIIEIKNKDSLELLYVSGFQKNLMKNGNYQYKFAYTNNKKHAIKRNKDNAKEIEEALMNVINSDVFDVKVRKTLM